MTGPSSEKPVRGRFHRCTDITYCTRTNRDTEDVTRQQDLRGPLSSFSPRLTECSFSRHLTVIQVKSGVCCHDVEGNTGGSLCFPGNTWRGDRPWEGSAPEADALSTLNSILFMLLFPPFLLPQSPEKLKPMTKDLAWVSRANRV